MKKSLPLISVVLCLCLLLSACGLTAEPADPGQVEVVNASGTYTLKLAPYSGQPYTVLSDNIPSFEENEMLSSSYEAYSPLDGLGRCGECFACIGQDLMPTEKRGEIGQVKPTGWVTAKYDFVDGKYLYNRCHLIGWQLSGENANERNLITGTRYMNVEGMLPFENMVADYVKETGNHVLYRVTPYFEEDNLLATGVEMEAYSVEDVGQGILFHVFCYNVQPGVILDYETGENRAQEVLPSETEGASVYVSKKGSKYHVDPHCSGMKNPKEMTLEQALEKGYEPCEHCAK